MIFPCPRPLSRPPSRQAFARALALFGLLALRLGATDPGTALEAAALAKQTTPGLVRAGRGIAEVPLQAAQCFRLPLGLVEMLLSPLPEVDFKEGLRDTGKGLLAPFKFCIATFEMPYKVFDGLGDALTP